MKSNIDYIDPIITQSNVRLLMTRMSAEIAEVVSRYYPDDFSTEQLAALIEDPISKIVKTWVNSTLYG